MNHPAKSAPELISLKDYMKSIGLEVKEHEYNLLSNMIASAYKFKHGKTPDTISFTYTSPRGKKSSIRVNGYAETDYRMIWDMLNSTECFYKELGRPPLFRKP